MLGGHAEPGGEGALQCEVTIVRERTGTVQRFTLDEGSILRIGRGESNDVVVDCEGVSGFHAELFLRADGAGQRLCVRDNSKNGTATRPGPGQDGGPEPAWEPLRRGAFRVLEQGWQVIVPMRGRTGRDEAPEFAQTMTFYIAHGGSTRAAAPVVADGGHWGPGSAGGGGGGGGHFQPPSVSPERLATVLLPPPPPPDLPGKAYERPPPPGET
mmetsp:Transcript_35128/g.98630  ORF Transcript_35128/g.98630 Transcript_35128/m.98630 type:complete len:213 (+) Transcript_35128:178-816(+)